MLLLSIISVLLLRFDVPGSFVRQCRDRLSVVAYPLQWLVDAPVRLISWVGDGVAAQQYLAQSDAKLRAKELLLQSKLQKLLILQKENRQLRHLLQTRSQLSGRVKLSRILAIQLSPLMRQMVISGGSSENFYVGQPVLDGYGVMGQVISVGPVSSRILLINDQRFSIPVQDYRNGIRVIASGNGAGEMVLNDVMPATDIKMGDVFVSSGYALRFPVGYPVGVVTDGMPL